MHNILRDCSFKQPFPVRPTFHVILASVQFQLLPSEYTLTGDNIIIFALCVAGHTVDFVCIGYVSLSLFEPWQQYVQRDWDPDGLLHAGF